MRVRKEEENPLSAALIQRRILRFFQEQPHAVETARGIATWVGLEVSLIGQVLKDLLEKKWLTADETSAVTGYALTRDERHLEQIRQLLSAE